MPGVPAVKMQVLSIVPVNVALVVTGAANAFGCNNKNNDEIETISFPMFQFLLIGFVPSNKLMLNSCLRPEFAV